jgi:hypothetical protein
MNIWAYIALLAIGIIIGMILHWYVVRDRIMNKTVEIRRNKQKGGPGNQQDIELEMNEAESGINRKAEREARQEEKKDKRDENKARRQLNKQLKNGGKNV